MCQCDTLQCRPECCRCMVYDEKKMTQKPQTLLTERERRELFDFPAATDDDIMFHVNSALQVFS
jgi:hypothetical protein